MTDGHETETIRAALIEGVRIGGRGFFVDYGDAAEQALNALRDAVVLYQAEWDIERERAEAAETELAEVRGELENVREVMVALDSDTATAEARLRELGQLAKNARDLADIPGFDRAAMRDVLRSILDAALAGEKS